jgi:hypothetical protein
VASLKKRDSMRPSIASANQALSHIINHIFLNSDKNPYQNN